jgi:hypothetical protein
LTKTIVINSARKAGTHFGEEFRSGRCGNLSAATLDKVESMRLKLPEIDWDHIKAIIARAEELHERSKMDRVTWLAPCPRV